MSRFHIRQCRRMGFLLFTVAMTALLVKLGIWQMSRGAEKEALLSQLAARSQQQLTALTRLPADVTGVSVVLEGRFDDSKSVLLDNQIFEGRVGYRWMIPFMTDNRWVLVELGWVPAPASRESLPELAGLNGRFTVSGIIDFPSDRVVLTEDTSDQGWPRRVQSVDMEQLGNATGLVLQPWLIRSDKLQDEKGERFNIGTENVWEPVVMKPEKHYAYAMQWFGLALVVVIGAGLWWRKA
ncbi:SURF1 family protein [Grimontia hollisae]|nr:SURF1 family protein [Grimontia hollisae]MDF2183747.1 SURF1 family protein [Grimontia hollisae]